MPRRSHLWRLWPLPTKQSPHILLFSIYYVVFLQICMPICEIRVCNNNLLTSSNFYFPPRTRTWRTSESTSTSNSLAASTKYATSLQNAATVDDFEIRIPALAISMPINSENLKVEGCSSIYPLQQTIHGLLLQPCLVSFRCLSVVPCFRQSRGFMETTKWRECIENHTDPSSTSTSSIRRSGNNWCRAL